MESGFGGTLFSNYSSIYYVSHTVVDVGTEQ